MTGVVAVTGATGFIGAAVMERLLQAGWRIRALYRPVSVHRVRIRNADVQWVPGALDDSECLERLVKGADAVIHCAGLVRGADRQQFNRVNVDGVARMVQAAGRMHPSPRFLLLSSLAAREPHLSDYARSKRDGERILEVHGQGIPWLILRPPAVYGPGDREIAPLLHWMGRGIAPRVASAKARFSMLYAPDLADAITELLGIDAWQHHIMPLHDGHPGGYRWREVVDTVGQILQRPIREVPIPIGVLRLIAWCNLSIAKFFGYAPMLSPGKVRELTHMDWSCDNEAIVQATGWLPRTPLADGMPQTLAYLGLIKQNEARSN